LGAFKKRKNPNLTGKPSRVLQNRTVDRENTKCLEIRYGVIKPDLRKNKTQKKQRSKTTSLLL